MQTVIAHATIHTGTQVLQNHTLIIENGVVQAIQPVDSFGHEKARTIDLAGRHIAPGFIDTHINGGEKHYFTQYPTEATIQDIYEASLALGTTHVLPCLITSPTENILKGIEATRNFMQKNPDAGVLGMHLEGPFLNMAKRGAHLAAYIRKPTNSELEEIISYGKDVIKIMTIAAENFTDEQLEMLLDSGIRLSLGHSNASYKQAHYAYRKGISLCTHLYNAMTQMGHREPGVVGATFDNPDVYAPIILDGYHCDYAAARIAYKIKKDKLFLISDALFVGGKVTHFQWEAFDAYLKDGQYRNTEGNLAGAAISMADAVRNAVQQVGISLEEAIKMATIRASRAVNLEQSVGQIAAGYPAKFVVFDEALTDFEPLVIR
ncbi:N-acetylglucosamine-6-phosphate deacetylase [Emticicia sp. TH156]|uniref:N-acetylglucosamine-6-phosphate deacetylase n=1 Tax=Emticicia sp. TH156 TaxID=2067454 RepID=UPI000C792D87|nr:N-acetylglucosamine-6-phosphate deacetylase [Emticicia sp. TH156]PLK45473.1 N-acetylglucosamine-6-phosphate deacetylase [Emticicia sp. TH156]